MPYLVDGNNLAHVLGLANGAFADREACGQVVAAFCKAQGARATIVFDGPSAGVTNGPGQRPRVRIEFSEARSADDVILRLVEASTTPKDFIVVTSDKSLGDKARHRGASVEKCHEFARRLHRTAPTLQRGPEKPARRESAAEIEAWLTVFDPGRK
jgi:predicted RNA-binding protein with PIN domain